MKALMQSNLFFLFFIMLPAFAYMYYNEQTQRIEPVEVYGMLDNLPKPKQVAISKRLPDQAECLAENLYFEARGEGLKGMIAVANVVVNRVKDSEFPSSYCEVVFQPKQFSWTNTKESLPIEDQDSWNLSMQIANKTLANNIPNLAKGARFYANVQKVDTKKHKWVKDYIVVTKVGNHTFMDKPQYVQKNNLLPKQQTNKPKPRHT